MVSKGGGSHDMQCHDFEVSVIGQHSDRELDTVRLAILDGICCKSDDGPGYSWVYERNHVHQACSEKSLP